MSIIDKTYFVQEINIPDSNYSDLSAYITKFENEILKKLLGYELWKLVSNYLASGTETRITEFVLGKEYTVDGHLIKWNGLKNEQLTSLIAYYVYYWFVRSKSVIMQMTGTMQSVGENTKNASPVMSLTEAWSRLEDLYGSPTDHALKPTAYNFLKEHEADYPEWVFTELGNVNSFDL